MAWPHRCNKEKGDVLYHDFPMEFGTFLDYTRGLSFDEEPGYCYLSGISSRIMTKSSTGVPHWARALDPAVHWYTYWTDEGESQNKTTKGCAKKRPFGGPRVSCEGTRGPELR
ncbi:hypothetical protein B0H14DRAFT_2599976 [Mycena olivaceomarginata]|nr:hypothetical protein B0H14DRAFT_2599976 [Mycena olivaceomarginata]